MKYLSLLVFLTAFSVTSYAQEDANTIKQQLNKQLNQAGSANWKEKMWPGLQLTEITELVAQPDSAACSLLIKRTNKGQKDGKPFTSEEFPAEQFTHLMAFYPENTVASYYKLSFPNDFNFKVKNSRFVNGAELSVFAENIPLFLSEQGEVPNAGKPWKTINKLVIYSSNIDNSNAIKELLDKLNNTCQT